VSHEADPQRWYTTNLVGVPAPVLGSAAFNAHPLPLHIAGTRETHAGLFALLARSADLNEAGEMFMHYLAIAYGLTPASSDACPAEQRRWRASYIKLLQGWGLDSNSPSGAVLKGWVESRFGLVPSFHQTTLGRFPSPAWIRYLEEKSASRFHNNCIQQQLDLLFEFCQWVLLRYAPLGPGPHVPLWRGSNRCEEQVVAGSLQPGPRGGVGRRLTLRLNNLVSFARERERAECFGDWVLEARVPLSKLLFFPGLLPGRILTGEDEVLVLGGDYLVQARYD
jgi:NAD+--dinitrogen-reductase ADP-D-ribosyltransferase